MRKSGICWAVLIFLASGTLSTAHAGPNANAKILLHLLAPTTKNACTRAAAAPTCSEIVTAGALYPQAYFAYLLVTDADSAAGIAGVQCGISYNGAPNAGVDIFSWANCATLEFPSTGWPASGGGNLITWDFTTSCQRNQPAGIGTGVVAVAGYFYCAAYGFDSLEVISRPADGIAVVASCAAESDTIDTAGLGSAVLSAGGEIGGYNPCGENLGGGPPNLVWQYVPEGPLPGPGATRKYGTGALQVNEFGPNGHLAGVPFPFPAIPTRTFNRIEPDLASLPPESAPFTYVVDTIDMGRLDVASDGLVEGATQFSTHADPTADTAEHPHIWIETTPERAKVLHAGSEHIALRGGASRGWRLWFQQPGISPSDSDFHVAGISSEDTVFTLVVPASGSPIVRIPSLYFDHVAPDLQHIIGFEPIAEEFGELTSRIVVTRLDGSLVHASAPVRNIVGSRYSLQGRRVVYFSEAGLHILDYASHQEQLVFPSSGAELRVSEDGSRIFFRSLDTVYLYANPVVGTPYKLWQSSIDGYFLENAAVSRSGEFVAMAKATRDGSYTRSYDILDRRGQSVATVPSGVHGDGLVFRGDDWLLLGTQPDETDLTFTHRTTTSAISVVHLP